MIRFSAKWPSKNDDVRPMAKPAPDLHEDLRREEAVVGSSNRSFGILLAAVGLIIGGLKWWHGTSNPWWWFGAAAALAALALLYPAALAPFNRLWLRLGLLLHKVVNPIVMALIFFGAVLPTALVVRIMRKDLLRLRRDPAAASYWIVREPAGAASETMKHQF
jgi:hypothetical protein